MSLISLVREGIRAVPAVRYALGIAAVAAVVAIIAGFQIDFRIALFGTVIVLGLMFVLLVFAHAARFAPSWLEQPAKFATWSFMTIVICASGLMLSSYFFEWPRPISQWVGVLDDDIATGHPVATCAADPIGSAVQLFERGWLLVSFKRHENFAIWRIGNGQVEWSKSIQDFVPTSVPCDGIEGNQFLTRGFRAQYCAGGAEGLRAVLGKPLAHEVRVWVQYQSWSGGLLIYGLPGSVTPITARFESLEKVFLNGGDDQEAGRGRDQLEFPDLSQGDPSCAALWYYALATQEIWSAQKRDGASCIRLIGPTRYTEPHDTCSISGF